MAKVTIVSDADKAELIDNFGPMNAKLTAIMADPGNTVAERKAALVDLAQITRRTLRIVKKLLERGI